MADPQGITPVLVALRERLSSAPSPSPKYDELSSLNYLGLGAGGWTIAVNAPDGEHMVKTVTKDVRGGGED